MFLQIPRALLWEIFSFLTGKELLKLCKTCRACRCDIRALYRKEKGLALHWYELEAFDYAYLSTEGTGTSTNPIRIDQERYTRTPFPAMDRHIQLQEELMLANVCLQPKRIMTRHRRSGLYYLAKMSSPHMSGEVFMYPDDLRPTFRLLRWVFPAKTLSGNGPWVGYCKIGNWDRLVMAKRAEDTGDIVMMSGNRQYLLYFSIHYCTPVRGEASKFRVFQKEGDCETPCRGQELFSELEIPEMHLRLYSL